MSCAIWNTSSSATNSASDRFSAVRVRGNIGTNNTVSASEWQIKGWRDGIAVNNHQEDRCAAE